MSPRPRLVQYDTAAVAAHPDPAPTMVSWWDVYEGKSVLCALHGRLPPSDEEWNAYLEHCQQVLRQNPRFEHAAGLAITDGGAPSGPQRKKLLELGSLKPTTAVVTDNALVRGVATALSWFNYNMAVLPPRQLSQAFDHLGIPAAARSKLLHDIRARGRALGQSATIEACRF